MISKAWIFLFGLVFCVQSISSSPAAEPMNDGRWDEFWQQDLEDSDDIQTREAPQPATTAASQIDPAANVFTPLAESNVQAHLDAAGSHNGPNTRSVDDLDDNDLDALEKRSSYEADEDDDEEDDTDFDFLVRRALGDYDDDDEDEDFDDFSKRSLDDFDADEDDDDDDDYLAKRDLSDEDFEDEDEDYLNKRSTGYYGDEDEDFDDFSKRSLGDIEEAERMYNEYTGNGDNDNDDDDDDEKRSLDDGEDDIEALDMTGYINMVKRAIGEDGDDELNGAIDMTPYINEVKASGNSQYAGV